MAQTLATWAMYLVIAGVLGAIARGLIYVILSGSYSLTEGEAMSFIPSEYAHMAAFLTAILFLPLGLIIWLANWMVGMDIAFVITHIVVAINVVYFITNLLVVVRRRYWLQKYWHLLRKHTFSNDWHNAVIVSKNLYKYAPLTWASIMLKVLETWSIKFAWLVGTLFLGRRGNVH